VALVRTGASGLEVLLTRRPATMAFAPNLHVFPGGAVDPADGAPATAALAATSADDAAVRLGGAIEAGDALAHHVAAIRELFEETGVLLATLPAGSGAPGRAILQRARASLVAGEASLAEVAAGLGVGLATGRLAPLGHWVPPPGMSRRFDARIFAAELPPGARLSLDPGEVAGHAWLTPTAALERLAEGTIAMLPPTATTLAQLAPAATIDDLAAWAPAAAPPPVVERLGPDLVRVGIAAAGGIPGRRANVWLVGRRDVVVVDPGDPSEAALAAVGDAIGGEGRIVGVALTSGDPDHAAGLEQLALRLGVPVVGGAGAGRWLASDVHELADGARLDVGDVPLALVAAPGPRTDHVAYVAETAGGRAAIVGDLVGPDPGGLRPAPDPAARRASSERLAVLGPVRVLPGHGPLLDADVLSAAATRRDS
jgi:glyoxylase-like metal-dependent hydrolase (beta-lactamase superfamily II)/8-oxo-dGTP pyrophosphatase MutT (NUDIX family)